MTVDENGGQRQLGSSQAERLAGQRLVHAVHFVQYLARLNLGDPIFRIALSVTHPHLGGLFGNRLVREDANPDPPASFDVPGHGTPRSFNLTGSQATTSCRLQSVFAEANLGAPSRQACVATLLFLPILPSRRLQHHSLLAS